MICQHCNNSFKSIKSLQQHQRKTKYCLLQQNKDFRCNGCNKISFSTNDNDTHMSNCIIILKNTISELKEENKDIIYFQEQMNKYKELNEESIFSIWKFFIEEKKVCGILETVNK